MADQDRIAEREGVARIIDPGAWSFNGLWPGLLERPGPHRVARIKAAEAHAAEENNVRIAVSLAKADAIITLLRTTHD